MTRLRFAIFSIVLCSKKGTSYFLMARFKRDAWKLHCRETPIKRKISNENWSKITAF